MDIVGILEANMGYFSQNVIWITAIQQIGWLLVQGLKGICDACENLFNDMYSLLDFTEYPALQNFFDTFQPVIAAVFIVSLLALGIMLTMGHNKGIKIVQNFVIFLAVITALPVLIQNLNDLVITGKDAIYSNVTAMSDSVIKSNVDDLAYMINNGFDGNEFKVKGNNISEDKISIININEVLEPDGIVKDDYEELITTQLDFLNGEGQWETKEIKDKWFSIFDPPYYYRYHVDFFLLYMGLLSLIIAFICTAYKTVRIIFEIVTAYLLAIIFSSEISGGRKIVKILDNLKNLYIALLMSVVMIKIFVLANDFINSRDFNNITKAFALFFFTLCLIDGPNIVEKVLGVDIGLSSAWGKMAATITAAKGAGKIASGVARATRNGLFGNPNSQNSKGGITGRIKDAFGSVTENHSNGNETWTNGTDKKEESANGSSSEFLKNHMNEKGTSSTNQMTNGKGRSDTNEVTNAKDTANMTGEGDSLSKENQDKNINPYMQDSFWQKVDSSDNTSYSDDDNQNIYGETEEGTAHTRNSDNIYNNGGVTPNRQNSPVRNKNGMEANDISWKDGNANTRNRNAFDSQRNLISDIPADWMWTPKNENENTNDISSRHSSNNAAQFADKTPNSDNIVSSSSMGDIYEQPNQSPSTGNIYEQPSQSPSIGNIYEQLSQSPSMGNIYEQPSQSSSTGNIYEQLGQSSSTGNIYEQLGQSSSTGNIYEQPSQSPSTENLYGADRPFTKTENVSERKRKNGDVLNTPKFTYFDKQNEYLDGLKSKVTNTEYLDDLKSKVINTEHINNRESQIDRTRNKGEKNKIKRGDRDDRRV